MLSESSLLRGKLDLLFSWQQGAGAVICGNVEVFGPDSLVRRFIKTLVNRRVRNLLAVP